MDWGCPLLSWAALYCCCMGERVPPLLVSVLVQRWRGVVAGAWCWGGGSILSGVWRGGGVFQVCFTAQLTYTT